jgi:hypothetical protein
MILTRVSHLRVEHMMFWKSDARRALAIAECTFPECNKFVGHIHSMERGTPGHFLALADASEHANRVHPSRIIGDDPTFDALINPEAALRITFPLFVEMAERDEKRRMLYRQHFLGQWIAPDPSKVYGIGGTGS